MSAHLLFYRRENLRYEQRYSWIDKWLWIAKDLFPICIDPEADEAECADLARVPKVYPSLTAALKCPSLAGMTWVWLDPNCTAYLDEFDHPKDNVIYCIGSDISGFNGEDSEGPRIKVRDLGDIHAAIIVPFVVYDRKLYFAGKRS